MSLSSGPNAREQAGAQTSHPYETVGVTVASNRRHHRKRLAAHERLVFWHLIELLHPCHFAPALQRPKYLREADRDSTCCPTRKTTRSVLEGLMVRPRAWQKLCMLSRRVWSPAGVQDSSTTSSAYTKEDTHLPEPSWTPACGAALSRWPCKPSKKIPKRVGLRGQPCRTPFC